MCYRVTVRQSFFSNTILESTKNIFNNVRKPEKKQYMTIDNESKGIMLQEQNMKTRQQYDKGSSTMF